MTTPERTVEEIVDKYWAKKMTLSLAQDLEKDINELLQTERKKREKAVEELKYIMKLDIGDISPTRLALQKYLDTFTQPIKFSEPYQPLTLETILGEKWQDKLKIDNPMTSKEKIRKEES